MLLQFCDTKQYQTEVPSWKCQMHMVFRHVTDAFSVLIAKLGITTILHAVCTEFLGSWIHMGSKRSCKDCQDLGSIVISRASLFSQMKCLCMGSKPVQYDRVCVVCVLTCHGWNLRPSASAISGPPDTGGTSWAFGMRHVIQRCGCWLNHLIWIWLFYFAFFEQLITAVPGPFKGCQMDGKGWH